MPHGVTVIVAIVSSVAIFMADLCFFDLKYSNLVLKGLQKILSIVFFPLTWTSNFLSKQMLRLSNTAVSKAEIFWDSRYEDRAYDIEIKIRNKHLYGSTWMFLWENTFHLFAINFIAFMVMLAYYMTTREYTWLYLPTTIVFCVLSIRMAHKASLETRQVGFSSKSSFYMTAFGLGYFAIFNITLIAYGNGFAIIHSFLFGFVGSICMLFFTGCEVKIKKNIPQTT